MEHHDEVLDNKTLRGILGERRTDSWTRRLRELRDPRYGGYTVFSHLDRKDLKPGQYLFPKQPPREGKKGPRISGRLRAEVLFQDAYTCQNCGLARGEHYEDGRVVKLHVAHNVANSLGGKATVENCFTLCSRCNEAESDIGPDRPVLSKTMQQVRRLSRREQRQVLSFLLSVFKDE
jgi:5-methylcytosine-specific restriction endonuclease McrA